MFKIKKKQKKTVIVLLAVVILAAVFVYFSPSVLKLINTGRCTLEARSMPENPTPDDTVTMFSDASCDASRKTSMSCFLDGLGVPCPHSQKLSVGSHEWVVVLHDADKDQAGTTLWMPGNYQQVSDVLAGQFLICNDYSIVFGGSCPPGLGHDNCDYGSQSTSDGWEKHATCDALTNGGYFGTISVDMRTIVVGDGSSATTTASGGGGGGGGAPPVGTTSAVTTTPQSEITTTTEPELPGTEPQIITKAKDNPAVVLFVIGAVGAVGLMLFNQKRR